MLWLKHHILRTDCQPAYHKMYRVPLVNKYRRFQIYEGKYIKSKSISKSGTPARTQGGRGKASPEGTSVYIYVPPQR